MLLLLFYQLKSGILEKNYFKHPLVILLFAYLAWIVICSVTSTHPLISFKSILARLWFIIPVFVFGPVLLNTERIVNRFFWALTIGTAIVIIYTVINHASYGFGEKESHWVMSPFYKDHTIYGAAVALVVPFPIMLYLKNKQTPLVAFILGALFLIILIGLYFSYTRAAWLSVFGALAIVSLVVFRIKFKVIFPVGMAVLLVLLFNIDKLQMELERNKTEHTTEAFDERLDRKSVV